MGISPFHAMLKARTIAGYIWGEEKLIPAFASANIEIYPHQVAAALFALRSTRQKGVILCDETGLGKFSEAMLIMAQKWYEGKNKILLVIPTHLLHQWQTELDEKFSLPYVMMDNNKFFSEAVGNGQENPFAQEAIVITSYDFAAYKADYIAQIQWNISLFEEAHRLRRIYTGENKGALALQKAVQGSFKLLLTATPIQTSTLDLYGLINFVDENIFTDEMTFKYRYMSNPENMNELAERVQRLCFRTMRYQVKQYVKNPNRIPITAEFELSSKETQLYDKLMKYLAKPNKKAFPKMQEYDLTLMMLKLFSSSTYALTKTLTGIEKRLETTANAENELKEIQSMLRLSESIKVNAKGKALLNALDDGFAEMKRLGANKKALIFTENRATQKYLFDLLSASKYKDNVLMFNGDVSRDYGIIDKFKNEAQILIATDLAAEGFNMEFCSLVINYDLPYNVQKIEQRIGRCHRNGQKCDVVVISFLNRNNFSDVRILQLINKRLLLFDGVFGASDDVIGNFDFELEKGIGKIVGKARTKDEVEKAFNDLQSQYDKEIKEVGRDTQSALFTTFDEKLIEKINLSPKQIFDKTKEINDMLWEVTKYFFADKPSIMVTDDTRSVYFPINPPKVFTGYRPSGREFSMLEKGMPASGRHTVTGTLAKNILGEMFWRGIPENGQMIIQGDTETLGKIGYYQIRVKNENKYMEHWDYYIFAGKTADSYILSDDECRDMFEKPTIAWKADGKGDGTITQGIVSSIDPNELSSFTEAQSQEYVDKVMKLEMTAVYEEIESLKSRLQEDKAVLERNVDSLKTELKSLNNAIPRMNSITEKLEFQKKKSAVDKELKKRAQSLFMDKLRLEQKYEVETEELKKDIKLSMEIKAVFVVDFMCRTGVENVG